MSVQEIEQDGFCQFLNDVQRCQSETALRQTFADYLTSFGYEIGIVKVVNINERILNVDIYNNLSPQLNSVCQKLQDAGEHPVFMNCMRTTQPFLLRTLPDDLKETVLQQEYWKAFSSGVDNGVVLPVYISNNLRGVVLLGGANADTSLDTLHEIHTAVLYLLNRWLAVRGEDVSLESAEKRDPKQTVRLTPRERECLKLTSMGFFEKQVAEQLGISPHTVRVHIENAKGKLRAGNKSHAIVLAIASGEVDISELMHAPA